MIEVGGLLVLAMMLAILIWGIRILVKDQIEVSRNRVVCGTPARILGAIYLSVPLVLFKMIFGGKAAGVGVIYLGMAVLATILVVIFVKDRRSGNQKALLTQTHKMPNVTIVRTWSVATVRTYAKVQCVCLVVIGCATSVVESMYQIRYGNHFFLRLLPVTIAVVSGLVQTAIPAIVFSAIVPIVLIKRIRMQWPMWMDYVLVETGLLLIIAIIVAIFLMILEPIFPLSKALRIFGSISIVVLPIGGLGVLSCQRVLKQYMKEIAQPTTPPYSEPATRSPQG